MPDKVFSHVESVRLIADVSVSQGLTSLVEAIAGHSDFRGLRSLSLDPHGAVRIYDRARTLLALAVDQRYRNPYDVALAAYLVALRSAAVPLARLLAQEITAGFPNLYWSRRMAARVLESANSGSGSSTSHIDPVDPGAESGESYLAMPSRGTAGPVLGGMRVHADGHHTVISAGGASIVTSKSSPEELVMEWAA
jgi:hypothetical protein